MTFREFQLRAYGWSKQEERSWQKVRKIAYTNLIAGGLDPKKTSEQNFMPIGNDKTEKNKILEFLNEQRKNNG